jgi:hypothetical protein
MREPEDEDGRGEVLEPRSTGRERVAEEVRREVPRADEPKRCARADGAAGAAYLGCGLGYARPALCSAA